MNPPAQSSYTQFPHIAVDWLMAILEPPEWVCMSYIIRRTYGFVGADGERKKSDVISLQQFERGITRNDGRVLDLGTGLAKSTIKNALEGLETKQLIVARYACTRCGWRQAEGEPDPAPHGKAKSPSCPACKHSLSRSFGLAQLSARKLEEILNRFDPKGRHFTWSREEMAYLVEVPSAGQLRAQREEDLDAEAARLRARLWCPELVDECVKLAEGALKAGGRISTSRLINGFYRPVIELQETYTSLTLIRYALEQAVEKKVPAGKRSQRWWRYPLTICENNKTNRRFSGAPVATDTNADVERAHSPAVLQEAVRSLLGKAADLNGRGDQEAARALLFDVLADANLEAVAPLFDGDRQLAECSLREAFKQGTSDFAGIDPADSLGLDFYEEWSWPETLPTPRARRREREASAAAS